MANDGFDVLTGRLMASTNDPSDQLQRVFSEIRLVNGSVGDPALYVDVPGRNNALLFDAGENGTLGLPRLADLEAVFITHHHIDHFIGLDRIVRANLDRDKTLQVFGPRGTILKVYRRVKSYEHPFFPFQKLVMSVHDVLHDRLRSASLECSRRFPRPVVQEREWNGPVVYEKGDVVVEAAHVQHTTACLAFALVVNRSPVIRIAYVTDTLWSEQTRPVLARLARRADRLYCDSFYAHEQLELARKYRHMTATQAAELAGLAGVHDLVLIHFASRYEGRYDALVTEARGLFPRVSAVCC